MNAMQALTIKYPTLWEHIAKGGKVRAYDYVDKITTVGTLTNINYDVRKVFEIDGKYWFEEIELLPLPKRVPTKDLGKAVNHFYRTSPWYYENGYFCNPSIVTDGLTGYQLSITINYIYDVITGSEKMPDWWPEELMEDEE